MSDKKTSPWVWVGIGCSVLFVGACAFVAFVLFIVLTAMRSNEPYKDGVARATRDARVIEALGAPVEPGWFVSGKINTSGRSGHADIDIPLKGSKQNGSVHVVGTKEGGRWTYTRMLMTPETGEPINLLAGGPGLSARLKIQECATASPHFSQCAGDRPTACHRSTRNAGVPAGWPAGVPRLRSAGGEDAAGPAAGTAAFRTVRNAGQEPARQNSVIPSVSRGTWVGRARNTRLAAPPAQVPRLTLGMTAAP